MYNIIPYSRQPMCYFNSNTRNIRERMKEITSESKMKKITTNYKENYCCQDNDTRPTSIIITII